MKRGRSPAIVRVWANVLLLAVPGAIPTAVDIPIWKETELVSKGWAPIPGSDSQYGESPASGPEDPFIYEAKVACTSGDSVTFPECAAVVPPCSASNEATKDDGQESTAVYWYKSLRNSSPPNWTFDSGPVCVQGAKPRDILAEIAAQIGYEFQHTPIAAATIGSQPGPHTLRGKDTNVYATATTQNFDITLLEQQVTIIATPVAYTWDYGDGEAWGPTPIHGAPLHQDRIGEQTQTSHIYAITGKLNINLTTHFSGTYSVNGGPFLPIPGQGNIPSPPLDLTVWRAVTRLYADDCITNPDGIGC